MCVALRQSPLLRGLQINYIETGCTELGQAYPCGAKHCPNYSKVKRVELLAATHHVLQMPSYGRKEKAHLAKTPDSLGFTVNLWSGLRVSNGLLQRL